MNLMAEAVKANMDVLLNDFSAVTNKWWDEVYYGGSEKVQSIIKILMNSNIGSAYIQAISSTLSVVLDEPVPMSFSSLPAGLIFHPAGFMTPVIVEKWPVVFTCKGPVHMGMNSIHRASITDRLSENTIKYFLSSFSEEEGTIDTLLKIHDMIKGGK